MNFGISKAVEAIGNAVKSVFDFASIVKKEQSETEVIKDKHKAEAANNIAEDIFLLVDKCRKGFTDDDWSEYLKLKKKFNNKD